MLPLVGDGHPSVEAVEVLGTLLGRGDPRYLAFRASAGA